MEKVIAYIDGFNLYYSLKRSKKVDPDWQKFYWLDFVKFFDHFIQPGQSLQKVCYFSAPHNDPFKSDRQDILFRANKLINEDRFELIMGKFIDKPFTCSLCNGTFTQPEEKRTDVNISAYMMLDCALNNVDVIYLVTADSDLITPIELIRQHYPHVKIKVFFPPRSYSKDLSSVIKSHKKKIILLKKHKLRFSNSTMPDVVTKDGTTITIPQKWQTASTQPLPTTPPSPPTTSPMTNTQIT